MVEYDADSGLIETSISGFLYPADVAGYVKDVQTAAIFNQFHHGYRLLVDVSGCAVQSQETLAAFAKHMASMPKADRIAVVLGGSPGVGQARRLFTQPYARLVNSREEAMAWLGFFSSSAGRIL